MNEPIDSAQVADDSVGSYAPDSATRILSHITPRGVPGMVDVSAKAVTDRSACARALVTLPVGATLFADPIEELRVAKGAVLATAIAAGTLAVKRTPELIPLCHGLPVTGCNFDFDARDGRTLVVRCTVKTRAATGVEMEAIIGVSMAAITIYDMCKSMGHDITIGPIALESKSGGKHDIVRAQEV